MKMIRFRFFLLFIVFITTFFLIFNCPTPSNSSGGGGSGSDDDEGTTTSDPSAGDEQTLTIGALSIDVHYVPGKTFPTGINDLGSATINNAFWISETEVTYELWSAVYDWAENGVGGAIGEGEYSFDNVGVQGDGAGGTDQHPVTTVNWRDAMIWMNALTEYYNAQNGANLECVYYYDSGYSTPIRDSLDDDSHTTEQGGDYTSSINPNTGGFDYPHVKSDTDGFRLPTNNEWELAGRYINDANNDGDILDAGEYYPGLYASGADAQYDAITASSDIDGDGDQNITNDVAVYDENGNGSADDSTAVVGSKDDNTLGIFDMNGNVHEWCFDWVTPGSTRQRRGGSWLGNAGSMLVGNPNASLPHTDENWLGFRIVKSN